MRGHDAGGVVEEEVDGDVAGGDFEGEGEGGGVVEAVDDFGDGVGVWRGGEVGEGEGGGWAEVEGGDEGWEEEEGEVGVPHCCSCVGDVVRRGRRYRGV